MISIRKNLPKAINLVFFSLSSLDVQHFVIRGPVASLSKCEMSKIQTPNVIVDLGFSFPVNCNGVADD